MTIRKLLALGLMPALLLAFAAGCGGGEAAKKDINKDKDRPKVYPSEQEKAPAGK
ncbi:MAG TPA: hypothetical protein VEL76_43320 [Gemmataceae bacterium]|nr:hypothetical protein [Gemmataceae bacterium]